MCLLFNRIIINNDLNVYFVEAGVCIQQFEKNEETGEKSWLKGQDKEKLEAYIKENILPNDYDENIPVVYYEIIDLYATELREQIRKHQVILKNVREMVDEKNWDKIQKNRLAK